MDSRHFIYYSTTLLGSGLGTSGNSLSVDDQISIGGENQFIIIGVQTGLTWLT